MQDQASISDIEAQLSAYFDGELEDGTRDQIEARLASDEELAARLSDLSFMREMVVGDLEAQANRVPEARFEQIWDNFEQTLERESRLQEAAEDPPSVWVRLQAWLKPLRVPIGAVAAAGALVVVFTRFAGTPGDDPGSEDAVASNTQEDNASDAQPEPSAAEPAPQPSQPAADGAIAVAPEPPSPESEPEMFPQPEPGEAEIRRIEFAGASGTISQLQGTRGTTTVIWVTEDEAPVDSERSL